MATAPWRRSLAIADVLRRIIGNVKEAEMKKFLMGIAALAAIGVAAAQAQPASASPNAKECPAGVTLNASATGRSVTVSVSPAINLKPATDGDADSFHLHYFVDTDPATVLQPGQQVPPATAQLIHSAATTQEFKDLAAGSHRVWVVLGDVGHIPCSPLVIDDVAFTIAAAPSAVPATGTGAAGGGDSGLIQLAAALVLVGAIVGAAGLKLRHPRAPVR